MPCLPMKNNRLTRLDIFCNEKNSLIEENSLFLFHIIYETDK